MYESMNYYCNFVWIHDFYSIELLCMNPRTWWLPDFVCTYLVFTNMYESKNISVGLHWFVVLILVGLHWIQEHISWSALIWCSLMYEFKNISVVCTDLVFTDKNESKNMMTTRVYWYVVVLISCCAVQFVVVLYWFVINWYVNMNTRLVVDMNMNKAVMILNTK